MDLKYIVKNETNLIKILKDNLHISNRLFRKIKDNNIFVNGENLCYNTILKNGDVIIIKLDFDEDNSNIVPNPNINFEILYEDEWLLIVNKNPKMPVHPSLNNYENTLSNGIKYYYEKNNIHKKIRPINRLDKDTSGIVMFAKSEYIQDNINILSKDYIAITENKFSLMEGTIDKPIARKDKSIIERCISDVRRKSYY